MNGSPHKPSRWNNFLAFINGLFVASPTLATTSSSDDPVLAEFKQDLARTTNLLNFLLRQGNLCHVPDELIDDVEASRDLLKTGPPPSKQDRVKLTTAYRDLVNLPRYSITYVRIPPALFWDTDSPWWRALLVLSVIPSVISLVTLKIIGKGAFWYWPIGYTLVTGLAIWGLYVFIGVVTDSKLNQIIKFCYVFTGIALLLSILPFVIPDLFRPMLEAPVGVLRGCVVAPPPTGMPGEVTCAAQNFQWVFNLGGTVWSSKPPSSGVSAAPAAKSSSVPEGGTATTAAPPPKPGSVPDAGAAAASSIEMPPPPPEIYLIRGGIVVPLYVVVLALFGGAVSMTRRVPEYQGRAMDLQDQLTNVQARERLVFQIMQLISAPLIAITAYAIISPASPVTSVVLGFGGGFASEPILLMIRGLVEKLSPAKPPEQSAVTVRVDPASASLQPKQTKQFSAKVSGSTASDVTWAIEPAEASSGSISQSGYYIAPEAVPTKAVTVIARSKADPTKSGNASVKIESVTVHVTPPSATLKEEQTQQFSVEISGTSNPSVIWSLDPLNDPEAGQISNTGIYTAPKPVTARTVKVIATSSADRTQKGNATVALIP